MSFMSFMSHASMLNNINRSLSSCLEANPFSRERVSSSRHFLSKAAFNVLTLPSRLFFEGGPSLCNTVQTSYLLSKNIYHYCTAQAPADRLSELPKRDTVATALKDMSDWLNTALREPQDSSEQLWSDLTETLSRKDNLHCFNVLVHSLATGAHVDKVMSQLPTDVSDHLADQVLVQLGSLRESPFIKCANLIINIVPESTQMNWVKLIPSRLCRYGFNSLRQAYCPETLAAMPGSQSRNVSEPDIDLSASPVSAPTVVQDVGNADIRVNVNDEIAKKFWYIVAGAK